VEIERYMEDIEWEARDETFHGWYDESTEGYICMRDICGKQRDDVEREE
jgi:hypothetical protein